MAHFRGLYVTGSAAAFLARRAAEARLGGAEKTEVVEMEDGGQCGVRVENFANSARDVERGGRGRGGTDEGEAGAREDIMEGHQNGNHDGDREREERARPGSHTGGEQNKHAGGHAAVAEGGGGARPYLEDSRNCLLVRLERPWYGCRDQRIGARGR